MSLLIFPPAYFQWKWVLHPDNRSFMDVRPLPSDKLDKSYLKIYCQHVETNVEVIFTT